MCFVYLYIYIYLYIVFYKALCVDVMLLGDELQDHVFCMLHASPASLLETWCELQT